jgi:hypothetical protein
MLAVKVHLFATGCFVAYVIVGRWMSYGPPLQLGSEGMFFQSSSTMPLRGPYVLWSMNHRLFLALTVSPYLALLEW